MRRGRWWSAPDRLQTMATLVMILMNSEQLSPQEHVSLEKGVDRAVETARAEARTPTVIDVIAGMETIDEEQLMASAQMLRLTLMRITSGAMKGMFDGESTADFSDNVPAVSIDTSAMREPPQESRRIVSACCGAWMEAMVTHSDGGQRVVVYPEGWDSLLLGCGPVADGRAVEAGTGLRHLQHPHPAQAQRPRYGR